MMLFSSARKKCGTMADIESYQQLTLEFEMSASD